MNLTTSYIKRILFDDVARHLDNKEITLIIGPRQVGKTVLLSQLQEYLIYEKKISSEFIFSFNLDIIQNRELFENQTEFIKFIKQKSVKQKIYIFIDEAQKVKEAGVFFKGVYDSDLPVKLILTGSSTFEIKSKIFESLTGRKRVFHLFPFSFLEILSFKDLQLYNLVRGNKEILLYDHKKILNIFSEYCVWGGYPRAALTNNYQEKALYLKEIFTSYIEKDVIGFLKIENENNFIKLVKLLASQIGNLINIAELSSLINTDRYTVQRYLSILEKTFVVYSLPPFFTNARQEIVKNPKIFFIDAGLRNSGLESLNKPFENREDKGALLENTILKELLIFKYNNINLKFWRSKQKAEVDFIIEKGLDVFPLEVKSNCDGKASKSFMGFIERYNPKQAFVISLNYRGEKIKNRTKINFIYPYELRIDLF